MYGAAQVVFSGGLIEQVCTHLSLAELGVVSGQ